MSTKYLNTDNILKKVYDPSTEGLRTTAVATFVGGTVDISISDTTDSIKIGDGTGSYLDIEPDGSINVNVINNPEIEIDAADGDNIAISDGTNTASVNVSNELNVRDDDANTTLDSILSKYSASTATITTVARSSANQQVLPANSSRKGCLLFNDTAAICYITFGPTSTITTYTFRMTANSFYEMAFPIYTGQISVIWGSNGALNLNVTELT